jgi:hypothetical protein
MTDFELKSNVEPADTLARINASIRRMRKNGVSVHFKSVMLTSDELENLVRRLDARTLEVIKRMRQDGNITLGNVAKIYGVASDKHLQLHSLWHDPVNELVKAIVGEACGPLIFPRDDSKGRPLNLSDLKYEIEGPTLWLLQAAVLH